MLKLLSTVNKKLLSFLAQIPAFILFPVFVIIFGIGEKGIYTKVKLNKQYKHL